MLEVYEIEGMKVEGNHRRPQARDCAKSWIIQRLFSQSRGGQRAISEAELNSW
jgi:hypothetical protein